MKMCDNPEEDRIILILSGGNRGGVVAFGSGIG
jgi:hypothetical protein